uniref:Uncharacterized protein n=1 Tax=Anguilla anguilla TaxID=7936 RepID=A0A0E9X4L2_ANGAN
MQFNQIYCCTSESVRTIPRVNFPRVKMVKALKPSKQKFVINGSLMICLLQLSPKMPHSPALNA